MKNRILSVILAIMLLTSVFTMIASAAKLPALDKYHTTVIESEEEKLSQMTKYLENDYMELYVHPYSGEIGLVNKKTGEITLSNPYNVASVGSTDGQKRYLSTVILKWKNITNSAETTYYSYIDSCTHSQFAVSDENTTDNKITLVYEFGRKEMVFPFALHEDDMNALLDRMRESDQQDVADIEKSISSIKKTLYDYFEADKVYTIKPTALNRKSNKEWLQTHFRDYAGLTIEEMHEMYKKVNFDYTTGKIQYGKQFATEFSLGVSYQTPFKVPVDIVLLNDGFNVSVDMTKVEFEEDKYNLISISLFPYFNPASRTDKGYSFIPDGSGVLIRYEDLFLSGSRDSITTSLYGMDYGLYSTDIKNQEQAIFPVFGNVITTTDKPNGFFAIIESGDAMASVTSYNQDFNSVYATFNISSSDKYDLADSFSGGATSSTVITVNGVQRYVGTVSLKYALLTPASLADSVSASAKYDTSYIGMANYYRDYLIARGELSKLTEAELDKYSRIFLEVFGSLKVEEKVMTFPVTVNKALTTFQDIITMHKSLSNYGVNNMSFILTGFANGGLDNQYPTYLKWQRVLGGADGYEELVDYANKNGIEIAPNIDFSYSKELKTFSGFGYKKTASKALDGRYSSKREYDASIQMFQRKGGVVIATDAYDLAYSKFMKSAKDYEISSLATRALGSDLSSDFDEKTGYIFREQAKLNTQNMLGKLSGQAEGSQSNFNLILDAGNAYTLKYASGLLKTPLDSSRRLNTSEAIPFVGLVLHGSIEFAGDAINMEGDDRYMFLKALENGANLYFTVAMQNTELLKGTLDYNNYYSVQFEVWKNSIVRMYNEYNKVMASKQGAYITEHEFLNGEYGYEVYRTEDIEIYGDDAALLNNSRVVRVEYENGEGFILNYNSQQIQVEYNGTVYTIDSLDYATYAD